MKQQGLFELHPSGQAMCLKTPPNPLEGFSVQTVNAYRTDEDLKTEHSWYIHSLPMLIMPIPYSPLYARIRYTQENAWVPRYTDSLKIISILRTIYACYNHPELTLCETHPERVQKAREQYELEIEQMQTTLQNCLNTLYVQFRQKEYNEREALGKFAQLLEQSTMEIIHALERGIMNLFDVFDEEWLTKVSGPLPDASVLSKEEQNGIPVVYAHYFLMKQGIMNNRLARAQPEGEVHTPITFFDTDDMATRLQNAPSDQIYKGYVDRVTLWEYFKFLDCDNILGEQ